MRDSRVVACVAVLTALFAVGCGGGDGAGGALADAATDDGSMGATRDAESEVGERDAGDEDAGHEDAAVDASEDDADEDAASEDGGGAATTCEDSEIECGIIEDDGDGNELNCEDPKLNPTSTEKHCEDHEECVDNRCECTSDLDLPDDEKPNCGQINDCTPEGQDLGDCGDREGANWFCDESRHCVCDPTSQAQACGESQCGTVPDGCGGMITCGDADGACGDAEECAEVDGVHTCRCVADFDGSTDGPTPLSHCEGKCGTSTLQTPLACAVNCGAGECGECAAGAACDGDAACACTAASGGTVCGTSGTCCEPSDAAALQAACDAEGKACGETLADPCTGAAFVCGCAEGECVDAAFLTDSDDSACLDASVANLVGTYAARTVVFTETSLPVLGDDVTRSEIVSIATVKASVSGGVKVEMHDQGCVAISDSAADSGPEKLQTVVSRYWAIAADELELQVDGDGWVREFASLRSPPRHATVGWRSELPDYCGDGTGEPRDWLGGEACTCPDVADTCAQDAITPACFPPENTGGPAGATDCRIFDEDGDGQPGYALWVDALAATGTRVHLLTDGDVRWEGTTAADGHHLAFASEPEVLARQVVGCDTRGALGQAACNASSSSDALTCGLRYNLTHFTPLRESLTCAHFYTGGQTEPAGATYADVAQNRIADLFRGTGPTCETNAECPVGMICHDPSGAGDDDGRCWPMTTPGACEGSGTCADSSDGLTWDCLRGSCWPGGSAGGGGCLP